MFRRGMNKANNRVQRLKHMPLDCHSHAMRHITPVGEALHFRAPVLDPLLSRFWWTAFIENRADFDFGSVAPYALHDPGDLARGNRSKNDEFKRWSRHFGSRVLNVITEDTASLHYPIFPYNLGVSIIKVKQVAS